MYNRLGWQKNQLLIQERYDHEHLIQAPPVCGEWGISVRSHGGCLVVVSEVFCRWGQKGIFSTSDFDFVRNTIGVSCEHGDKCPVLVCTRATLY